MSEDNVINIKRKVLSGEVSRSDVEESLFRHAVEMLEDSGQIIKLMYEIIEYFQNNGELTKEFSIHTDCTLADARAMLRLLIGYEPDNDIKH